VAAARAVAAEATHTGAQLESELQAARCAASATPGRITPRSEFPSLPPINDWQFAVKLPKPS
jgi:hypothetical protein